MKYVIEIPSKADFVTAYYMEDGLPVMYKSDKIDDLEPYTEPDRKDIEDEVWEFARKMVSTSGNEVSEMWGCATNFGEVMHNTTYQEAKSKFEAWLKQKDEIFNTGDEVWDDELKSRGVVLRIYNSGNIDILWDDGSAGECIYHKKIHKTGRHFPEVAELLKKMRGEEE